MGTFGTLDLGLGLGGVRHPDVDMWMAAMGATGAAALLDFAGQKYGLRNAAGVPRWGSVAADMVFARASAAGRWPAAGPYEMVGSNVLRYDHDPVTRAPLGVRIEGAATNLVVNSTVLTTSRMLSVTAQTYTLAMEGAGSIALSGAYTGSLSGGATRQSLTFAPSAGSLTLTPTGEVLRVQLEAGTVPSSYIVTGASAVTRAAERLYLDLPFDPAAEGITVLWDGVLPQSSAYAIYGLNFHPTASSGPSFGVYATGGNFRVITNGGWGNLINSSFVANERRRVAFKVTPTTLLASFNGGSVVSIPHVATVPTGMTRMDIGNIIGYNHWGSTIRQIAVWRGVAMANAEMQELSAL